MPFVLVHPLAQSRAVALEHGRLPYSLLRQAIPASLDRLDLRLERLELCQVLALNLAKLSLDDVELFLVFEISFAKPRSELFCFLGVKRLVVLAVLLLGSHALFKLDFQSGPLDSCDLDCVLKSLRVFDSSVAILEVLCGQLVPQFFLFGKTLFKLSDLLFEVAVFHIKFLLTHDPILLVALNSIVE